VVRRSARDSGGGVEVTHTYEPLTTFLARCSCGWTSSATTSDVYIAKVLWESHEHSVDPAKSEARKRLREAAK
jgi:hypothetical protein